MANKSGELAAKALILANEELLKENDTLKRQLKSLEGLELDLISERNHWQATASSRLKEMTKERELASDRADKAEGRLQNALSIIGGLALDMFEDTIKHKKEGN